MFYLLLFKYLLRWPLDHATPPVYICYTWPLRCLSKLLDKVIPTNCRDLSSKDILCIKFLCVTLIDFLPIIKRISQLLIKENSSLRGRGGKRERDKFLFLSLSLYLSTQMFSFMSKNIVHSQERESENESYKLELNLSFFPKTSK